MRMTKTKKLVLLALMVAIALALNYFERFIPIVITLPGVKLGLANVVSLIALSLFGFSEVLTIVILRTVLSASFYGSISALMFSLAGGVLSLIGMKLLFGFRKKGLSTIGISVFGAVCHNIGQVTVAVIILNSTAIYAYLPFLLMSSVVTGIVIGIVAERAINYLDKSIQY
jgi:heptaprenyl diphosphate synthase